MANKKSRTPKPPSSRGPNSSGPVQAPRRRDTKSSNPLAEVPRWVWFVSVGVIAGVVLIGVILASGGKSSDAKAAMLAAGCTYRDVKPFPPKKDPTELPRRRAEPRNPHQGPVEHLAAVRRRALSRSGPSGASTAPR